MFYRTNGPSKKIGNWKNLLKEEEDRIKTREKAKADREKVCKWQIEANKYVGKIYKKIFNDVINHSVFFFRYIEEKRKK